MVEKNSKPKKAADSGWSDAEKAAMKERAKELKAEKATKKHIFSFGSLPHFELNNKKASVCNFYRQRLESFNYSE